MTCGIFEDKEILDNLEFDYGMILKRREQKETDETDKEYSNY